MTGIKRKLSRKEKAWRNHVTWKRKQQGLQQKKAAKLEVEIAATVLWRFLFYSINCNEYLFFILCVFEYGSVKRDTFMFQTQFQNR